MRRRIPGNIAERWSGMQALFGKLLEQNDISFPDR